MLNLIIIRKEMRYETLRSICRFNPNKKKRLVAAVFLLMSLVVLSIIIVISVWTVNVHKNVHELSDSYISDIVRNANSKFENDLYTLRSNLSTITANDNTRTYLLYPTAETRLPHANIF